MAEELLPTIEENKNLRGGAFSGNKISFIFSELPIMIFGIRSLIQFFGERPEKISTNFIVGANSGVLEEYAEAMLFLQFLKDGSVLSMSALAPINANEYLGGLLDFTGEVNTFFFPLRARVKILQIC